MSLYDLLLVLMMVTRHSTPGERVAFNGLPKRGCLGLLINEPRGWEGTLASLFNVFSKPMSISSSSSFSESYSRYSRAVDEGRGEATPTVTLSRSILLPDQFRIDRCKRLPEYGPRILFFSGGSALHGLSCCLKHYTYNSIHIVTPFDSGGSSAEIRRAFNMLSVGDLRNRLMALADDESALGNPEVAALFSHRLHPTDKFAAAEAFTALLSGQHDLAIAVAVPMRSILLSHLRWFASRMPKDFDLRGASVGNLIITGCFLEHDRDIVTAIYLIWKLVGVKGLVRPLTGANLHIRTLYHDGTEELGQHKLGKSEILGAHGRIIKVDLVKSLDQGPSSDRQKAQTCEIDPVAAKLVNTADLIVYPMGSFFGSVLINLVPQGVGKAIVQRSCPKVYIPNTGLDPEMWGYTLAECAGLIIDMVRRDAGAKTKAKDILKYIVLDSKNCEYCVPIEREKIAALGIEIIDVTLAQSLQKNQDTASKQSSKSKLLDPQRVVEILLSLGS